MEAVEGAAAAGESQSTLSPPMITVARAPVSAYMDDMNEQKSALRRAVAYETDFSAWTADQALRLRAKKPAGLDWDNLAEEVESLGKSDRRAVGSALKVVLEHLLKWQFQPEKRSSSWSDSIDEHRDRISRVLEDSPSLATLPAQILEQEYRRARRKALRDARLLRIACRPSAPILWTRFSIPTSGRMGKDKPKPAITT